MNEINTLQEIVSNFGKDRNWKKFHSPKNLAMALNVEAGELLELFQWLSEKESRQIDKKLQEKVSHEAADVFMYLLLLCEELGIDLQKATQEKIKINERRFKTDT